MRDMPSRPESGKLPDCAPTYQHYVTLCGAMTATLSPLGPRGSVSKTYATLLLTYH